MKAGGDTYSNFVLSLGKLKGAHLLRETERSDGVTKGAVPLHVLRVYLVLRARLRKTPLAQFISIIHRPNRENEVEMTKLNSKETDIEREVVTDKFIAKTKE